MMVLRTLLIMPSAMALRESLAFSFSLWAIASWIPVLMMTSESDSDRFHDELLPVEQGGQRRGVAKNFTMRPNLSTTRRFKSLFQFSESN